ncbi:MAG: response regulator [Sphingosinicella sp.]|nr:response regulator [Sphingosinicella sp.]
MVQWLKSDRLAHPQRIYVVDDDSSLSGSARFLLATLKLGSRTFKSGQDFLDQVNGLAPGVILLDLRMPGMDGFAVQEALKRLGIDWPVVLMTGEADMPVMARTVRRGAVELILKPFSDEKLLAALCKGFGRLADNSRGLPAVRA